MVWKFTRRSVLALAGSLAALGLGLKSKAGTPPGAAAPQPGSPLPEPSAAPFDTVVVLMMENRSFDHVFGWLPGANGRQGG
jgi:phospholipase C